MAVSNTVRGGKIKLFLGALAKIPQIIIQSVSLLAMAIFSVAGLYKLFLSFYNFPNIYLFLKEILHSLEILFIAPIPVLIIFSFRKYITMAFPPNVTKTEESAFTFIEKAIDAIEAKKAFITSIIGITSTFLLGLFLDLLSKNNSEAGNVDDGQQYFSIEISNSFIFLIVCLLVFLIIQIILFHLLNKKHSAENPDSK